MIYIIMLIKKIDTQFQKFFNIIKFMVNVIVTIDFAYCKLKEIILYITGYNENITI